MSNGLTSVQYALLESTEAGLRTQLSTLQETISQMNQQVAALTATDSGKFSVSFQAAQAQINSGFQGMENIVNQLATVISEARTSYAEADQTAASYFN